MKISARPSSTAPWSTATDGSSNSSQSSQTLVSRMRIKIATAASGQHQQLGRGALLHEHDRVLAEDSTERFRVLAVDPHDQGGRRAPRAAGLAPLARAPRVADSRDQLVEHRERGSVL